ncbi:hypothetical protein GCM10028805_22880 [Spirosoma harenae]
MATALSELFKDINWAELNIGYVLTKLYDAVPFLLKSCSEFEDQLNTQSNNYSPIRNDKNIGLISDFEYTVTNEIVAKRIVHNVAHSNTWAKEISFKDSIHSKDTKKIFVQLDFFLTPKKTHFETSSEPKVSLKHLDFSTKNVVILGGPGAGKTTLMKNIFINEIEKTSNQKEFAFPFVIQFRYLENVNDNFSIFDLLFDNFGIDIALHSDIYNSILRYETILKESEKEDDQEYDIDFDEEIEYYRPHKQNDPELNNYQDVLYKYKIAKGLYEAQIEKYSDFKEQLIAEFVDKLNILLIFDGFDELPSNNVKLSLIKSIERLSLKLNNTRFILTSRTGEFDITIPNCRTYEIADLNNSQITQFIDNWFDDKRKSLKMMQGLENSPFKDTALRPLNLAHLCALFERSGEIPRKPKTVYKKIVNLLIEDWDEQRRIKRQSKFSQFTLDRKFDFLCNLSYYLTAKLVKVFFTTEMLKKCYADICESFQLPPNEVNLVVNELESFTGLFVQSGFDRYEFSHKSLQEYLAGEYLIRSNFILARKHLLIEIPNEVAVAISLASNPSILLASILFNLSNLATQTSFLFPFFQRLILEKPDFESSYFLPLSLIYLYDKIKEHNGGNLEEAKEMIFSCAPKDVMRKSFMKLKEMYGVEEVIDIDKTKVKIVGNMIVSYDLEELNVPAPYNAHIIMDDFIKKQYISAF